MTRSKTSRLIQARTGKIGLRSYLHSIKAEESKDCTCGQGPQAVQHVLLCCPEFDGLREKLWEGERETNLMRLLGTPGQAKQAAQLMIDTGELTQFKYARQASLEDSVEDVSTGETSAED